MVEIQEATKNQAAEIASLIMMAMTDDCCLYFCGDGYGLEDFRQMMTMLVEREDSQYSYKNTLVGLVSDTEPTVRNNADNHIRKNYFQL